MPVEATKYDFVDNVFPYTYPSEGNVNLTGPDGLRDYRPHVVCDDDQREVGVGDRSTEHSGGVAYLFRPAPNQPTARPRSAMPGEIGWGVPLLTDWRMPSTGQQIMLGQFRQTAEDRSTHEHMGCWYPAPDVCTPQGSDGYYHENIYSGRPGTSNTNGNARPATAAAASPRPASRPLHSPAR